MIGRRLHGKRMAHPLARYHTRIYVQELGEILPDLIASAIKAGIFGFAAKIIAREAGR